MILVHIVTQAGEALKRALVKSKAALEKVLAKKERLIAAKGEPTKASTKEAMARTTKGKPKPKLTPEEMKAFRVELMAKARAAKKAKKGK